MTSETPMDGNLDRALQAAMENSFQQQLFRSLSKIERHLSRRDPQSLQRIRQWYSSGARVEQGRLGRNPQQGSSVKDRVDNSNKAGRKQQRSRTSLLPHGRMEQHEIDNAALDYLKIPKGIARRSLLVPPQPAWLFSDHDLPQLQRQLPTPVHEADFAWLPPDTNASNAEELSRRFTEREFVRQKLEQWVFLYFRVLRRSWERTIVEEKKASPDLNMYVEEQLQKWTVRLRFRIMRKVPVKVALNAFLSRLGLESDEHIVFCRDGFYGLMDVGNIYGEKAKTPSAMISFSSTPRYMGLKNGDNIFVNSLSLTQRQMMENAHLPDELKGQVLPIWSEDEENMEEGINQSSNIDWGPDGDP